VRKSILYELRDMNGSGNGTIDGSGSGLRSDSSDGSGRG